MSERRRSKVYNHKKERIKGHTGLSNQRRAETAEAHGACQAYAIKAHDKFRHE